MSAKETWSTVTLMPLLSPHFTAMGSNQASYAGTKWLHVMIRSSRCWARTIVVRSDPRLLAARPTPAAPAAPSLRNSRRESRRQRLSETRTHLSALLSSIQPPPPGIRARLESRGKPVVYLALLQSTPAGCRCAWPLLPSAGDDRTQREATGTFVPGAGRGDDQKAKNDAAQQRQPLLRRRPQGPWRDCQSDDGDWIRAGALHRAPGPGGAGLLSHRLRAGHSDAGQDRYSVPGTRRL